MNISKHAEKRLKERCGTGKKTSRRMARKVFKEGIRHSQTKGKLNKWVTKLYFKNQKANNIRLYGDKAYIFCGETLVTVVQIQGRQLGGIVEEVYRGWQENRRQEKVDMGFFPDYGQVKNRVCYKVIGLENNRELLEQVPHVPFLDMAAVFYCDAPELETDMAATVLIRNRHMEMWGGVTAGEMYREAGRNTPRIRPPKLQDIREVMHDMGRTPLPDGAPVIYVLGNGNRMFGAAVILYDGVLDNAAETLGDGFYVLPSSIHETILVPGGSAGTDAEKLREMVRKINATQVDAENVLTSSVYRFSRRNKKLEKVL